MVGHVAGFSGPLTIERFKGIQPDGQAILALGFLCPAAAPAGGDAEGRPRAGLPVTRVYAACLDEGVIGSIF